MICVKHCLCLSHSAKYQYRYLLNLMQRKYIKNCEHSNYVTLCITCAQIKIIVNNGSIVPDP
jgi:hypothetical protein